MWNLPGSGLKLMSLALAGIFFITEPPGNPSHVYLLLEMWNTCKCKRVPRGSHGDASLRCLFEEGIIAQPPGTCLADHLQMLSPSVGIHLRFPNEVLLISGQPPNRNQVRPWWPNLWQPKSRKWLSLCLPIQGAWVCYLIRELDFTCCNWKPHEPQLNKYFKNNKF